MSILTTLIPVNETTLEVKIGDIFLTRNAGGDIFNNSPGYYNHTAILGPLNWIIESQRSPDSIITVPIWNFLERYPEILVLRNDNTIIANQTAQNATLFVGRPYAPIMSIRPFFLWKYSDNCVSFIKRVYNYTTGITYPWTIPDSFLSTPWLIKVALKKDYESFQEPSVAYLGMQKKWLNQPAENFMK
jgi:hypothetical protein